MPPPPPAAFAALAAAASCDPTIWAGFGPCSGSPAEKTRINQCGGLQSIYCTGTIRSRAVLVDKADTSCAAVQASATGINGTTHQFTAGSSTQPAPQVQSGVNYVTFSNIFGGTYTIAPTGTAPYVLARACWTKGLNAPLTGEGLTSSLSIPDDGDTLTWDLGYTLPEPWTQAQGGNVMVTGNITSPVPSLASPRVFNLDGAGGYPGLVTYNTTYDFDPESPGTGETLVSSTNWLANHTPLQTVDYYTYFYQKLGGPVTEDPFPDLSAVTKPASRAKPYYVTGDMTTSGNWTVGDGESIIMIVNGNLTIGGTITITGSGFIAFIVKGNITVSSNVGVAPSSSAPVLEGMYITSPTGTFHTGTSTVAGKERLVGKGMFIAGTFALERDLSGAGGNGTYASELFIYNPQLFFTMPDALREVPITWQEVAP